MTYQVVYKMSLAVLASLLVLGSCVDVHVLEKRRPRVDCTRYVFAPACRGVSAKRSFIPAANTDDVIPQTENFEDMVLRSFLSSIRNQDSLKSWRPSEALQYLVKQAALAREEQRQQLNNRRLQEQNDDDDDSSLLLPRIMVKRNTHRGAGL